MNDEAGHQGIRDLLGSYVLGHLSEVEAGRVRAHLDGCAACRADVDEIAPLAAHLSALDPDAFESPAALPPGLGDAIRSQIAEERGRRDDDELSRRRREDVRNGRRSRVRMVGVAAALVLIGTAGGVGIGRWTAPDVPVVPKEPIALTAATGSPVRVESADLVNHTWGTELRFVAEGFEDGATFRAAFRLSSGDLVPAGEFIGVGGGEMTCNLQSAALREDVTEVLVTDTSGQAVLSSRL